MPVFGVEKHGARLRKSKIGAPGVDTLYCGHPVQVV
jgi:hypothetical protein